ncbi:hypothetical protein THMIRHAM_11850 [Thiomicrorhabdus immobilis]|uniref:Uncharacterized protein n=1 Tax=Thiomicrorhabdus immobilis TaxID=2791037 RepID=A0ABN6CWB1_9GAMM|nr:hypothetical protein [Thiomicrorhabdus immobilis]BCN93400.1 hypothetical protein THMIRHAM_11850 [Thiomicrorhabdus immobilis]
MRQLTRFNRPLIAFLSIILSTQAFAESGENAQTANSTKPLKEVKFLGLKLIDANLNTVRTHLWDIGGFKQASTTIRQRNIDKFFPKSSIRDSYYVTFHYNHAGDVVSVKRLYRPYSIENSNKRTDIQTKDVALKLIKDLGQPSESIRKGWGGTLSYQSYIWQDETMQITVDREGGERLGNVYIEYRLKTHDRYAVDKDVKT